MVKKMEATITICRGLNKCRSRVTWNKKWDKSPESEMETGFV